MIKCAIFPRFGSCETDFGIFPYLNLPRKGPTWPIGPAPAPAPTVAYIFHASTDSYDAGMVSVVLLGSFGGYSGNYISTISIGAALGVINALATPVRFHVIGAGQAGFNGANSATPPGGNGGEGGSYASVLLAAGANNVTVQIGTEGASNGAAGNDSSVKNNGVTIALGRGGGSGSSNVGTNINPGGTANTRNVMSGYLTGLGGTGGGGAGGPNGPGGNGGDISPKAIKLTDSTVFTFNGGTGGGAGNGGTSGFTAAYAGNNHIGPPIDPFAGSPATIYEFTAGDGGDANSLISPWWFSSGAGSKVSNAGFYFGGVDAGRGAGVFGGAGGRGCSDGNHVGYNAYIACNGWLASGIYSLNQKGLSSGLGGGGELATIGSVGSIWGALPLDFTTTVMLSPVPQGYAGPGGGGGGGAGGAFSAAGVKRGSAGAQYGGGGGGGGNWTGGTTDGTGGAGGPGVIVAMF